MWSADCWTQEPSGTFRAWDVTVKSHCFLVYQMWKFSHPFINRQDPVLPVCARVQEAVSWTISQLCSSDGLMDALMLWQIVFNTSAPCWHAPWLRLIIPWTMLFLKSSRIFLLVLKLPAIAYLIPASDIGKSTREVSTAKTWSDISWYSWRFCKFKDISTVLISSRCFVKMTQNVMIRNQKAHRFHQQRGGFPSHQECFMWAKAYDELVCRQSLFVFFYRERESSFWRPKLMQS